MTDEPKISKDDLRPEPEAIRESGPEGLRTPEQKMRAAILLGAAMSIGDACAVNLLAEAGKQGIENPAITKVALNSIAIMASLAQTKLIYENLDLAKLYDGKSFEDWLKSDGVDMAKVLDGVMAEAKPILRFPQKAAFVKEMMEVLKARP